MTVLIPHAGASLLANLRYPFVTMETSVLRLMETAV
jgi:hypothetical protein